MTASCRNSEPKKRREPLRHKSRIIVQPGQQAGFSVEIIKSDAAGLLFAHGSRFGGHSLFIKDKKLYYVYNFLGI